MTDAELVADLRARIAILERQVTELSKAKPADPATYLANAYPKRPDEV